MTSTYTIAKNEQYGSHEVYFDSKPALAVIEALKNLKMRWNPKKACWYGFAEKHTLIETICANSEGEKVEDATIFADGYMGATATYGSKSNNFLYGAELSAAIRADIKKAGIKGVSIRVKTFAGGQDICATVRLSAEDLVDRQTFVERYRPYGAWVYTEREAICRSDYLVMSPEEKEKIRCAAANYSYNKCVHEEFEINENYISECIQFTKVGLKKIYAVNRIICAYRYDNSNSMVDYFDTNFYYTIKATPPTDAE